MNKAFMKKIDKIPIEIKSAFVYTFATVFSRGLAIVTVPIFTRIMTSAQIGIVNIYNSWYSIISSVATLSLTSGGFITGLKEFSENRDEYQSSVLSLTSIIAIIISASYFVCPSYWSTLTGLSSGLLVLMLIGFLVAPARDFWLARQRYEYKYKLSGLVIIVSAIFASLLSVIVVIWLNDIGSDKVAEGRLYANYSVLYSICAFIWLYTLIKGKTIYNGFYWKYSLKLSLPLVGYSVASQILNVSDRSMIGKMVGNSAVGIYGTLYTVSSLSLLVWQAIHSSFVPYLFQNLEKPQNRIKEISFELLLLYSVVAILLTYFAPEIVRILATEEYYEAIYIMPPIAAGVFFTSFTNLYSDVAVYYKKTTYVMYPAIIAAICNFVLNLVFIKTFGYMAAAYTTLIAYIIFAFLQCVWERKICKENNLQVNSVYDDKKALVLAIVTVCLTMLGLLLYSNTYIRYLAILSCLIILAMVCFKRFKDSKRK